MRSTPWIFLLIAIAFPLLTEANVSGQTPDSTATEFWPSVKTNIELRSKTRLELSTGKRAGEDFDYLQWHAGAMLNYRMKRMLKLPREETDEEKEYNLVIGVGYEHLRTTQNDQNCTTCNENPLNVWGLTLNLYFRRKK